MKPGEKVKWKKKLKQQILVEQKIPFMEGYT